MQATYPTPIARRLAMATMLSLLLNSGLAQVAAPAAPDAAQPKPVSEQEETITLSPFVVDASKDQGYRANSTLAGSRIATSLKDLSAPLTIVTKELLTDVGAVSVNDILSYTAGTEGTRDFNDAPSSLGRPVDNVASNPNGSTRIRGLGHPQTFRDYFRTLSEGVGFDTYNLDQVTISKGPNSVLAGLGSASGIINYSPQLANFGRNANQVTFRVGSYGSLRGTLNSNYIAVADTLAIRVAGAWTDDKFKQKPSFNKDKRLYAAVTYQPFKKTTVRASFETVKIDFNRPNTLTPEDDVTSWVAAGKPSYDRSTGTVGATLFHDGNGPLVIYNKDGSRGTSYNPVTDYVYGQPFPNIATFTPFRMNNNNYIELDRVNLSPSQNTSKFHALNLSVDQEILPNLNANISYLKEGSSGNGFNLFRAEYASYLVDVNTRTVTGAVNPHYGETYMQFRGLDNKYTNDNSNRVVRGTLTYSLDLRKYNKWLGHYALTGFAEDNREEFDSQQYNVKSSDVGAKLNQEVSARYYLGGSATTKAVTTPRAPTLVSGVPFVNPNGTSETLTSYFWKKSEAKTLESLKSSAFIAQGFLWDDQIVGMFGIRRDKDKKDFATVTDPGDVDSATGQLKPIGKYSDNAAIAGQTKSYGVVYHTPLKWLSLHYNRGNTFQPNSGTQELNGKITPPPSGHGKDYGFSVDMMNDKLNLKVNWFDLVAANDPAASANFPVAQWTLPFQELIVEPAIAAFAGVANYKKAMADGLIVGDPRLTNAYTANTVAKGIELELTYNVTKNWRVSANVTKQEAKQSGIAANLTAFIDERLAYWKSIPALWSVRYASSAIPAAQWGGQPDGTVSGEGMWNQFSNSYVLGYKSSEGKPSQQLRKWSGNLTSNYQFSDGPLKGINFGGSAHYRDKTVIGNPAIYQVINGVNTAVGLDVDHPYTSGAYIGVDAWIGYKMKVYHNKYNLGFQLNVRDLQESGHFRPIGANSDGAHSVYQIVQPRTWFLTTTLDF